MADLGMNFDATQIQPQTGKPDPLPTDWYNVIMTDSEMKPTKDGNGGFLEVVLKVMDGPYAGRQMYDRLNLYNQNEVAVKIAQETLSAICHAVGVFQVRESSVLHGKPFMARAVEKDAEGGYDAGNDVKGYAKLGEKESKNGQGVRLEPRNTSRPATATATMPQPAVMAAPAPVTPPWGGAPATPAASPVTTTSATPPGLTPPWMK